MDLRDKRIKKYKSVFRSVAFAWEGINYVIKTERNMRIHVIIALFTMIGAILLRFSLVYWLVLLLVIAGVLVLEMMNTALEHVVDLITKEFHPLAKRAKDIAAATVFVYCIFAIFIGLILFISAFARMFL